VNFAISLFVFLREGSVGLKLDEDSTNEDPSGVDVVDEWRFLQSSVTAFNMNS